MQTTTAGAKIALTYYQQGKQRILEFTGHDPVFRETVTMLKNLGIAFRLIYL